MLDQWTNAYLPIQMVSLWVHSFLHKSSLCPPHGQYYMQLGSVSPLIYTAEDGVCVCYFTTDFTVFSWLLTDVQARR